MKISMSVVISVVLHGCLLVVLDLDWMTERSHSGAEPHTIEIRFIAPAPPSLPLHAEEKMDLASEAITAVTPVYSSISKSLPASVKLITATPSAMTAAIAEPEKQKVVIQEKIEQTLARSATVVEVTQPSDDDIKSRTSFTLASTSTSSMSVPMAETKEAKHARENYLASLRAAISRYKYYPVLAQRMRKEGEVWVEFFIYRDGRIDQPGIRESSGEPMLDRAAKQSVLKLGRYRPFPEHIDVAFLSVAVPMRYTTQ